MVEFTAAHQSIKSRRFWRCPLELIQAERESGPWGEYQMMQRKRHTEEQIIAILKEHEAGMKVADLCRKYGISEATFYNWKVKYGGLEVSEAKRLTGGKANLLPR